MGNLQYLPSLGTTGVWSLADPYRDLVVESAVYRCDAITLLAGALTDGSDPLNNVYLASGDTEERYATDLENDDYLITISSDTGAKITFPRSAMLGLPKSDGVVYQTVVATVSLSAMPENYDYINLESALKTATLSAVGVNSSVYFMATGERMLLSYEQDELLKQVRAEQVVDPDAIYNKYVALQESFTRQSEKLRLLEEYVAKHFAGVNPP